MHLFSPFVPYHTSAGSTKIAKFGGLLTSEFLEPPPGRSFMLRQTYRHNVEGPISPELRRLIDSSRRPKGPPMHFHQFQTEYFKIEHGICVVEIDGVMRNLTPEDEETSCKAGHIHRFFIHPESDEYMTVILSASDPGIDYQLDRVFFENWYGYWHDALLHDGGLDLIQTLCMHDAGDHYTPAPAWMPFRRFFGYWGCIIIGRWLGGMLGYKPFFKEYTTDWDFAVAKMRGSIWTRRLVQDSYSSKKPWHDQVKLSADPDPTNADYQYLLTNITETMRASQASTVNGSATNSSLHSKENGTSIKNEDFKRYAKMSGDNSLVENVVSRGISSSMQLR